MSTTPAETLSEQRAAAAPLEFRGAIRRSTDLAARGLVSMFNADTQIFCHALRQTESGLRQEGISRRYTMMSLMGLHKLEASGTKSPIPIQSSIDALLSNLDWVDNVGDLGVLLWTCARIAPERLEEIESRLDLATALTRFEDARQRRTVELSWFLTGLAYAKLALPQKARDHKVLADSVYQLLLKNQSGRSVFGFHSSDQKSGGLNRSRIGCFADQVYPIYAFTRYAQAFGENDALAEAAKTARHICGAQGTLGQWWWHYDSWTGKVIGAYPVFSVHQHAMAPMVLFALGEATNTDYAPWIYKGLRWLNDNELAVNMEDASANVVWRCIAPGKAARLWRVAKNLITRSADSESRTGLKVLHECRPYELGWMLYAFASQRGNA
jgi:hypothetical protein